MPSPNVIPNLAVRVNMEVSRGATPYMLSTDDELYKKLTGGHLVQLLMTSPARSRRRHQAMP